MSGWGLGAMLAVQLRTAWRTIAGWVLGIVAGMVVTVVALKGTYGTPAEIAAYARTVGTGPAIRMLNGEVAGIDSFGGIVANEFGFIASFALPVMGVALVCRLTRRDEEAGRLELLLASPISRHAPLAGALVVTVAAALAAAAGCAVVMASGGVAGRSAVAYALAIASLVFVFGGLAAVAAQVFEHTRAAWGAALAAAVLAYVVRGVGAAEQTLLVWASPMGWFDEVRAMGDARWWPLAIPLAVGAALFAVAFALAARRDLGSSMLPARRAPARASGLLMRPYGLAVHERRGAIAGWAGAAVVVMGMYGLLTDQVVQALRDNPTLRELRGVGAHVGVDQAVAMFGLVLAMVMAAAAVQLAGGWRRSEESGQLETELEGRGSRARWLGVQAAVVAVGVLVAGAAGALSLGLTAALSTGDVGVAPRTLVACAAYIPAAAVMLGLCVAAFGLAPRMQAAVWAVFAAAVVVGYLGPGIGLPSWAVRLSPFAAVGKVPSEPLDRAGVAVLLAVTVVLTAAGVAGFRRRDVPAG